MKKPINFKDMIPQLSEEHIKQICRFTKTQYIEGEWQKWQAYAAFKWWHLKMMQKGDGTREMTRPDQAIKEF